MKPAIFACAAIGLGGLAFAQNVPEKFVVSGKAAEKIQDFSTINMATAERIAEACEKAAVAEGVQISIMVLDNDGNHVYMDRMDGQGYLNIITADMKARTALPLLAMRGSSSITAAPSSSRYDAPSSSSIVRAICCSSSARSGAAR